MINIMLLENDPIDVMSVKRIFKKNSINNPLYVFNNGSEGLAILRQQIESGSLKQELLMLLDFYTLQDKGTELLRELEVNLNFREIPVIFLLDSWERRHRIQTCYINTIGYLIKPIIFPHMAEIVSLQSALSLL